MTDNFQSRPQFSVLVVGCGLSGLASALAIVQAGHRVTVFERSVELSVLASSCPQMPRACSDAGASSTRSSSMPFGSRVERSALIEETCCCSLPSFPIQS
ncbi:hypothetical protein F4678DRAFT_445568 [Xylaria arbuscula]|nr:hypothetical protein F4678DRAFT_445568 [Xylaria arbuscula]